METKEHREVGDALRIQNSKNNPYLSVDEEGVLSVILQRFANSEHPEPMDLKLTAGEIIAVAADYFTQADWTLDLALPQCEYFRSTVDLGQYLIKRTTTAIEQDALLTAYNNLAAPDVTRAQIERIYKINSSTYIPFSKTLNGYMQQLMLSIRVKNYGEMVTRNITHFTPWSIKAYVLGHAIALRYAQLSCELHALAANQNHQSTNADFAFIEPQLTDHSTEEITDLAHRYHALAIGSELFTFHYYTDHFAAGHLSMIADLRVELQTRFGNIGSILANNLHDEVNRVGVFTYNPYDPLPNPQAPVRSRGDGAVDSCLNRFNRQNCILGMTASLADVQQVLEGKAIPKQREYGGLKYLPDVDFNARQHEPLLVYSNQKIYCRKHPSKINIISPTEYQQLRADPLQYGYQEISSKWDAFRLMTKLRIFPYLYHGAIQPLSKERKKLLKTMKRKRPLLDTQ